LTARSFVDVSTGRLIPQQHSVSAHLPQAKEEYEALFNRIGKAHLEQTLISVGDVMLLWFFNCGLRYTWINANDHFKGRQLLTQPGSPIYKDKDAQAAMDKEVEYRQKLNEIVKAQYSSRYIVKVERSTWLRKFL